MRTRAAPVRAIVVAGSLGLGLLSSAAAIGEEIRVLLLVPDGLTVVAAQKDRLERAIAEAGGPLVVVSTLGQADVVVELTEYRRRTGADGEPLREWFGHVMAVRTAADPAHDTPSRERFSLLVAGEDGTEDERTIALLEKVVARALGLREGDEEQDAPAVRI